MSLFPRVLGRPIAAPNLDRRPAHYSQKRYGDVILKSNKPATTIAKLQRLFWNKHFELGLKSYQACASFPAYFRFDNNFKNTKDRLGNSVPPMFMRAIAFQIKHKMWGGRSYNLIQSL